MLVLAAILVLVLVLVVFRQETVAAIAVGNCNLAVAMAV